MDSKQQLVDCLADHLALYHSASASSSAPKTQKSKFRNNVLTWISSLSIEQRQAALTIVDESWVTILLQMEAKTRENGAGFFILLPDVLVEAALPSLCYRKAKGLVARVWLDNEEEKTLVESVRLFSSKEGQIEAERLAFDSLVVGEDLVKDVDCFVKVMDRVSDGEFLRSGDSFSFVSAWEELAWLKAKGYYSVGAFLANKLEIALRMSWLNSQWKKRGGNCVGNGVALAGFAASVFWRKKVCVEWWRNVDQDVKAMAFEFAVMKAAKVEVNQLVGDVKDVVGNKTRSFEESSSVHKVSNDPRVSYNDNDLKCHTIRSCLHRKYSHSCNFLSGLHMLEELSLSEVTCKSAVPRDDILFFSSLSSTHTVLDNIMRRVREVFAKVSIDYVELDLLNDVKAKNNAEVTKKVKRKKGRRKKKKVTPSEQDLQNTFAKQQLEDASPKKMACEEKLQRFKFQENDRKNTSRLQKNFETEQSDMVEVHVKNNKQGRGRSKLKKKDTVNLDVSLLTNGKGRMPENCCEQTEQQAVDIQQTSSVQYDNNDGSVGNFCSFSINSSNSLVNSTNTCTDDNRWVCSAKQTITCLDKVGTEASLSMIDFRVNHDTDIKEVGAQNDLSPKFNIFERDKGDANLLSGDCKSTSASVVPLKGINNLDGIIPSSGVELSSPVQHCKLNNKPEHENSQCSLKPNTFCSGMCNSNSIELLGSQDAPKDDIQQQERSRNQDRLMQETATSMSHTSYEWPGSLHRCFPPSTGHPLPETTDRLHLDVDCKLQHHYQPSFLTSRQSMVRNSSGQGGYLKRNTKCQAPRKGSDQSGCNLIQSIGHSFEAGFTPFVQPSFQAGYIPSNLEFNGHIRMKEDSRCEETDDSICDDLKNVSGYTDDFEGYVMSEGEVEKLSYGNSSNNADYNQVFGGGVMYWNTTDYGGTGFSRPPSLSSEDSSWARHEDDLKFVIEDIVNITSLPGTYGNGGVTSPPTTFHSTFDQFYSGMPNTPGNFMKTNNDFSGNIAPSAVGLVPVSEEKDNRSSSKCTIGVVDGMKGEVLPHPILRPININLPKQRRRSDLSISPCLTGNQREPLRLKRPPSPVVLCVLPAPPPPPPSPVGDFRKQRRFPNVRSGSSSPRHWGLNGWPSESEMDLDDCRISTGNPEVVNFAWRRKCITATLPMHSLPSALLRDRLFAISQVGLEQEQPDIALPLQSAAIQNNPALQASVSKLHSLLHDEIESFCTQVAAENLMRKPFINAAVERVSRALQVLWPRSRTKTFGSIATGLAVPTSDVDLVVCLPPVRNLEPIKEAGILEGRNGIKETCLQHAARYLADQEWVKSDSLKTIENTAIPVIMLKVKGLPQHCSRHEDHHMISSKVRGEKEGGYMPCKVESESLSGSVRSDASPCETRKTPWGSKDSRELVHLDISFESPSHTGLKTANLVKKLIGHFPAIVPLALVLKQFLTDRSLDHPYSGGLGSYCLVLLITRFLQHEHHSNRAVNQNLGSLFMDFLYFFGCVFDPRQMRVSIRGTGMYLNRDRGQSIDPLHIDDPLHQANNVGRNCFRIHQCIKAFADAHSVLEKEVNRLSNIMDSNEGESVKILPKVIPSIADMCE